MPAPSPFSTTAHKVILYEGMLPQYSININQHSDTCVCRAVYLSLSPVPVSTFSSPNGKTRVPLFLCLCLFMS